MKHGRRLAVCRQHASADNKIRTFYDKPNGDEVHAQGTQLKFRSTQSVSDDPNVLPLKYKVFKAVSPEKTSEGNWLSLLLSKYKVFKAVSPEKTSEGNWLSLLFLKSKVFKAVRPFRSPFGKDFREFSLMSNVWSCGFFWNKSDGRLWSELPCTMSLPRLFGFPPRKRWCKVGRWERWAADKLVRRFSLMDSNWSFSSPTKASASSSSSLARPKSKILRHFKCLNLPDGMATRELLASDICVVWHPNLLKASGSMLLRFVNTSCFCCSTAAKPQLSRWSPMALSEQRQGKQVKFLECPG